MSLIKTILLAFFFYQHPSYGKDIVFNEKRLAGIDRSEGSTGFPDSVNSDIFWFGVSSSIINLIVLTSGKSSPEFKTTVIEHSKLSDWVTVFPCGNATSIAMAEIPGKGEKIKPIIKIETINPAS